MSDLYYLGDTVNLKFLISNETSISIDGDRRIDIGADAAPALTSINVSVFGDDGQLVREEPVNITNNVASYSVSPSVTKTAGDYAAFFDMVFNGKQAVTYKMPFSILPRSVDRSGQTSKLEPESSEAEIEAALGQDIRAKRKAGKPAQEAYAAAQEAIGRRLAK